MPTQLLVLTAAMFAAAFLQATSGFGFALLAMPLITLALGLELAGPVVAGAALFLYIANTLRLRRHVNGPEWLRLGAAGLLGVPLGFWLSAAVPAAGVRALLGVLLIGYALYALLKPQARPAPDGRWVYLAGFTAGALASAYNIPGPPVIVYGELQGWARNEFRATLQAFFLLNSVLVVGGHALLGHFDSQTGWFTLVSLPALLVGNLAGQAADRFLDNQRFRQLVLGLLFATGVALVR